MGIFDFLKKNKVKSLEITNDNFKKLQVGNPLLDPVLWSYQSPTRKSSVSAIKTQNNKSKGKGANKYQVLPVNVHES